MLTMRLRPGNVVLHMNSFVRGSYFTSQLRSLHATTISSRGSKQLDWYFNALAEREAAAAAPEIVPYPAEALHGRKRARVFLDMRLGDVRSMSDNNTSAAAGIRNDPASAIGRIVVELADDLVPLTARNFLNLCERPIGQGYLGSEVLQVRKGLGVLFGDWTSRDGRGGHSSFGDYKYFHDENFIVRHSAPGILTMANAGVHSNSSIFMITLGKQPHLDGRNVAFGKVLTGMEVLNKISSMLCVNLKPATPVVIAAAGVLPQSEWAAVDKQVAADAKAAAAAAAKASAASATANAVKGTKTPVAAPKTSVAAAR